MPDSPFRRLRWALLGGACLLLVAASGATGRSNTICGTTFNLGTGIVTPNTCDSVSALKGAAGTELDVENTSSGGQAIRGLASGATGTGVGVFGQTNSNGANTYGTAGVLNNGSPGIGSAGLFGYSFSTNANGPGVYGQHLSVIGSSAGVLGETSSSSADATGVKGQVLSTNAGSYSAGVEGYNAGATYAGFGVYGHTNGNGIGVYGAAPRGFALAAFSPFNWAAWLDGSVMVTQTLYKGAGAFRIDNPIDPAHSYLQHSFVESPDMKNIYDGVAATDAQGFATIKLPAWFEALNKDFRYQLTIVGRSFAQAIVWKEIAHDQFTIRTNQPRIKVSWQVTGIRHDAYADANRIKVVVPKTGSADGKYLHPELYGQPMRKSIVLLPGANRP